MDISEIMPGDICQLILDEEDWQHTPVIVSIDGDVANYDTVHVAAHSYDCNCRPLSSYAITEARFIHIDGVRSMLPTEPEESIGPMPSVESMEPEATQEEIAE